MTEIEQSPKATMWERVTRKGLYISLGLAILFELLSPLLVKHLGTDGFDSLRWIESFSSLLRQGIINPHWLPNSYDGLGASTFYFYPPFAYYIAAIFRLLIPGASTLIIYNISGFVLSGLSVATCYWFLKTRIANNGKAWVTALIYGVAPFQFHVLYIQCGLSAHAAFVWLPLIFLGSATLLNDDLSKQATGFLILSCSWFMLLITHIPSVVLAGVGCSVALGILSIRREWQRIIVTILALFAGTLIAGFYLSPILHFKEFAQLDRLNVQKNTIPDAMSSVFLLLKGFDFTDNLQGLINYLGLIVVTVILWVAYRRTNTARRRILLFIAIVASVSLFFEAASISQFVWQLLDFTKLIQFTWRWNLLATIVFASAYGLIEQPSLRVWARSVLIVLLMSAACFAVLKDFNLRVHAVAPDRSPFDPAEYAPASAATIPDTVIRFATLHEQDPVVQDVNGNMVGYAIREVSPTRILFSVDLKRSDRLVLHHWFWPSWVVTERESGKQIPESPDSSGRATFQLDAGHHELSYQLSTSTSEVLGRYISLFGLVILVGAFYRLRLIQSRESDHDSGFPITDRAMTMR